MLDQSEATFGQSPYAMQDPASMTKLETAEGHSHPALDVGRQEYKRSVLDDHLQVRVQELQHEIEIRL